jgi:hypothetical protein
MYEKFSQNDNLSIRSLSNDNLSFGSAQKNLAGCPCKKPISGQVNNNPFIDELLIDSIANGGNNGSISSQPIMPSPQIFPKNPVQKNSDSTPSNKDVLKYLSMLKKQKMEGNLKLNSG